MGGNSIELHSMNLPDLLRIPDIDKFVISSALSKYREDHDCPVENNTKDRPTSKPAKSSLGCSDFITVPQANAKSANAVADCLLSACEKECEFKNTSFKAELESYVKGAIEQHGADLEALN